jgi:hypothetical protein
VTCRCAASFARVDGDGSSTTEWDGLEIGPPLDVTYVYR